MARHDEDKGWFARNWGWCVGCGCLLPLLAIGALIGGGAWSVNRWVQSNPAIDEAMQRLNADPRATAALGTPIEPQVLRNGTSIRFGDGADGLDAKLGVAGPTGRGRIELEALPTADGGWRLERLRLRLPGGEAIDLLEAQHGDDGG